MLAELTSQHPPQVQALDNSQAKLPKVKRWLLHGLAEILEAIFRDHRQDERGGKNKLEVFVSARTIGFLS